MKILSVAAALAFSIHDATMAQTAEGVLVRCGASSGYGYYFHDPLMNPEGPEWTEDGNTDGSIFLVRLGQEWDIQFGDVVGEYGYRQDGAKVIPLGVGDGIFSIGAFRGTYTDIYTFDLRQKEVAWSSHKTGTLIPKVGAHRADCSFVHPSLMPD